MGGAKAIALCVGNVSADETAAPAAPIRNCRLVVSAGIQEIVVRAKSLSFQSLNAYIGHMRIWIIGFVLLNGFSASGFSQTKASDKALLEKTRALYDSPFLQGLVSFDCAVKFNWKQHFLEVLPSIPPNAIPTIDRLQAIQHRVFVSSSGAVVSSVPKAPDLSGVPKATEWSRSMKP